MARPKAITERVVLESLELAGGRLWGGAVPPDRQQVMYELSLRGLVRREGEHWVLTNLGTQELRGGNPAAVGEGR